MNIGEGISGAIFSNNDHTHRYALWRIWDRSGDCLLFIGLNPSRADHIRDDPTVRRVIGFAKHWGYGGLFVGNLYYQVTAYPGKLISLAYQGTNNQAIKRMRELCTATLVGWGNWGNIYPPRPAEVLDIIGEPVYCLKVTKTGEPSHPLYLPYGSLLIEYKRGLTR